MTLYETTAQPYKEVVYQDGSTLYAHDQDTTGAIYKSIDNGFTWKRLGAAGFRILALTRVHTTNTLLVVELTNRTLVGQNPKVKRSTDDGASWTLVTTLNFPGLGHQSIVSPSSGVVIIGEYGNVGAQVYRILRSTDDGRTWAVSLASPGNDPRSDPGHFHSITKDPYSGTLLAFMDRSEPEIYGSVDDGATWSMIGRSAAVNHPNFVAPLYFEDYIAWGVDNEALGSIYRLSRVDFYAGNWDNPERVAQLNRKVFYDTFPIRPDTWVISGATEAVGGDPAGPGSYAQEVYVVTDNGATVAGGAAHATPSVDTNSLVGQRASLPGYPASSPDQKGRSWINLNAGGNNPYSAVAYSVGEAPSMPRTTGGFINSPIIPNNLGIRFKSSEGDRTYEVVTYDANNRVRIHNDQARPYPELRLYEGAHALFSFMFDDAPAVNISGRGVTSVTIGNNSTSRESVLILNAPVGNYNTIQFLRGGAGAWRVFDGNSGNLFVRDDVNQVMLATFVPGAGVTSRAQFAGVVKTGAAATAARPAMGARDVGSMMFDSTLNKPIWWTGAAWVDATGTSV